MAAIAVAAAAPPKSDVKAVAVAEHGMPPRLESSVVDCGGMFGHAMCVHMDVSVCIVQLSIVYTTECVYTVSQSRTTRITSAAETPFQPQVLSHGGHRMRGSYAHGPSFSLGGE